MASSHLLALGHRTVHHVAGLWARVEAQLRCDGWRQTLHDHGAPLTEPLRGDWSASTGYAAGVQLAADPEVTAVFAANDQMSLGVLRAMHEAGVAGPRRRLVVGFDDTPESGYFVPPLTTVRQNFSEVGARAVRVLTDAIDTPANESREPALISPELVVRTSSATPRMLRR